jgi:hypothetical protein
MATRIRVSETYKPSGIRTWPWLNPSGDFARYFEAPGVDDELPLDELTLILAVALALAHGAASAMPR